MDAHLCITAPPTCLYFSIIHHFSVSCHVISNKFHIYNVKISCVIKLSNCHFRRQSLHNPNNEDVELVPYPWSLHSRISLSSSFSGLSTSSLSAIESRGARLAKETLGTGITRWSRRTCIEQEGFGFITAYSITQTSFRQ